MFGSKISSTIFSVSFVTNHLEPIISDGSVAAKKSADALAVLP
jgi:hypothetical protein